MGEYIQGDDGKFEGSESGGGNSAAGDESSATLTPASGEAADVGASYTQSGIATNTFLREGSLPSGYAPSETAAAEDLIAQMDNAIASQPPLDGEATVFRSVLPYGGESTPQYGSMAPGDQFVEPAFMNTTSDENVLGDSVLSPSGAQTLEVHVPEGSQVLALNNVYNEVVLPRGSEFQVMEQLVDRTVVNLVPNK